MKKFLNSKNGDWGLGIWDWGLLENRIFIKNKLI